MMKKFTAKTTAMTTTILAVTIAAGYSFANNKGFPVDGQNEAFATQQPARYFVKYQAGKESEVRELLRSLKIEMVDALVKQRVLVVSGSQEQMDQLAQSEWIDYTEQEPVRQLYTQ
ncbi:ATPase [Vibrio vulnificus]|nr:ATPase [Vibrio vulnificus]